MKSSQARMAVLAAIVALGASALLIWSLVEPDDGRALTEGEPQPSLVVAPPAAHRPDATGIDGSTQASDVATEAPVSSFGIVVVDGRGTRVDADVAVVDGPPSMRVNVAWDAERAAHSVTSTTSGVVTFRATARTAPVSAEATLSLPLESDLRMVLVYEPEIIRLQVVDSERAPWRGQLDVKIHRFMSNEGSSVRHWRPYIGSFQVMPGPRSAAELRDSQSAPVWHEQLEVQGPTVNIPRHPTTSVIVDISNGDLAWRGRIVEGSADTTVVLARRDHIRLRALLNGSPATGVVRLTDAFGATSPEWALTLDETGRSTLPRATRFLGPILIELWSTGQLPDALSVFRERRSRLETMVAGAEVDVYFEAPEPQEWTIEGDGATALTCWYRHPSQTEVLFGHLPLTSNRFRLPDYVAQDETIVRAIVDGSEVVLTKDVAGRRLVIPALRRLEGIVTVEGRPAPAARVSFEPDGKVTGLPQSIRQSFSRCVADTSIDGSFELTIPGASGTVRVEAPDCWPKRIAIDARRTQLDVALQEAGIARIQVSSPYGEARQIHVRPRSPGSIPITRAIRNGVAEFAVPADGMVAEVSIRLDSRVRYGAERDIRPGLNLIDLAGELLWHRIQVDALEIDRPHWLSCYWDGLPVSSSAKVEGDTTFIDLLVPSDPDAKGTIRVSVGRAVGELWKETAAELPNRLSVEPLVKTVEVVVNEIAADGFVRWRGAATNFAFRPGRRDRIEVTAATRELVVAGEGLVSTRIPVIDGAAIVLDDYVERRAVEIDPAVARLMGKRWWITPSSGQVRVLDDTNCDAAWAGAGEFPSVLRWNGPNGEELRERLTLVVKGSGAPIQVVPRFR